MVASSQTSPTSLPTLRTPLTPEILQRLQALRRQMMKVARKEERRPAAMNLRTRSHQRPPRVSLLLPSRQSSLKPPRPKSAHQQNTSSTP